MSSARSGVVGVAGGRYGARWKRMLAVNLFGVAILAWFTTQMLTGRVFGLGAGLVVQSGAAQFSTAQLNTTNVAFAVVPISKRSGTSGTSEQYILRFGFAQGKLDGFCLSQTKSILGSDYTIRLTARDGATGSFDLIGKNVQFDVTSATSTSSPAAGNGIQLKGDVALGGTAQSVTTWLDSAGTADEPNPLDGPGSYSGINGRLFAVDSSNADLFNLKGDIYDAIIQGPVDIKNLKIEVVKASAATAGCKNIDIVY